MTVQTLHPKKSTYYIKKMLIGGRLEESESGQWMESINPANEEVIGKVPSATPEDVARAYQAAALALPEWVDIGVAERVKYLHRLCDAVAERASEIVELEVIDSGNPRALMKSDIDRGIERVRFMSGLGLELKGSSVPATPKGLHFTIREPYGVVGKILAFNHPFMSAMAGIAAPLTAGNTLIEKPSEQNPLSSLVLGEIASEILPPGVLNILTGTGANVGQAIAAHPKIKRISFVGSARTGMAIQNSASLVGIKHISLECGGKNPFIVYPDANYSKAVAACVRGMNFNWQSQSCSSTTRIFVHESLYNRFCEDVVQLVNHIRIRDPFDPECDMGAIVSAAQRDKVMQYINAGLESGARLLTGGTKPVGQNFAKGYWVLPTVFADVTADMAIAREEIFGPVLSILSWRDPQTLYRQINELDMGLTASIWTSDISTAFTAAKKINAGYVWINGVSDIHNGMPYGGFGNSGVGRERNLEELLSYTEEKSINISI